MKVKKISIALILCMSIVFCDIYTVRANILTSITSFCNLFHKLENGEINNLLDFIDQAFSNSGLIGPKIPGDLQSLEDFIHSEYPSLEGQTSEDTQENISDSIKRHILDLNRIVEEERCLSAELATGFGGAEKRVAPLCT